VPENTPTTVSGVDHEVSKVRVAGTTSGCTDHHSVAPLWPVIRAGSPDWRVAATLSVQITLDRYQSGTSAGGRPGAL
jgi:hypothetical protein